MVSESQCSAPGHKPGSCWHGLPALHTGESFGVGSEPRSSSQVPPAVTDISKAKQIGDRTTQGSSQLTPGEGAASAKHALSALSQDAANWEELRTNSA